MFRARVTIERYGNTQDDTGGLVKSLITSYSKYAEVKDRRGSQGISGDKREWSYDYEVRMRYEPSRVERSNDMVVYDGKRMAVKEVSYDGEGTRRYVVLRCSFVETVTTATTVSEARYGWQATDPTANLTGATYISLVGITGDTVLCSIANMPEEYYFYFQYPTTTDDFTKYDVGLILDAALPDQTFKVVTQGNYNYIVTKDAQTFNAHTITFHR